MNVNARITSYTKQNSPMIRIEWCENNERYQVDAMVTSTTIFKDSIFDDGMTCALEEIIK